MKTCLVTGASRGFGAEIVKAGLVARDKFIAAARIRATLPWFSERENVLALNMEVADDVEVSTWQYRTLVAGRESLKGFNLYDFYKSCSRNVRRKTRWYGMDVKSMPRDREEKIEEAS